MGTRYSVLTQMVAGSSLVVARIARDAVVSAELLVALSPVFLARI
jgi:hypothetical protein